MLLIIGLAQTHARFFHANRDFDFSKAALDAPLAPKVKIFANHAVILPQNTGIRFCTAGQHYKPFVNALLESNHAQG
jgi:hypothetical protein